MTAHGRADTIERMRSMDDVKNEFLLKEYESLRAEISTDVTHQRQAAIASVLASSAVWSWLATSTWSSVFDIAKYVPFVMSLLALLGSLALGGHVRKIGEYILKVESHLKLPTELGWERFLAKKWQGSVGAWGVIFWPTFWAVLLLGNLIAAMQLNAPANPSAAVTAPPPAP